MLGFSNYSTPKLGRRFCRIGFTCRCAVQILFGIPTLPGGQAQYVRVPKAGGTLFSMNDFQDAKSLHPSSLLLMSDILPTGVFAATQLLQHAKLQPMLSKTPYPCTSQGDTKFTGGLIDNKDCALTIGIVGLGPVGLVSDNAFMVKTDWILIPSDSVRQLPCSTRLLPDRRTSVSSQ